MQSRGQQSRTETETLENGEFLTNNAAGKTKLKGTGDETNLVAEGSEFEHEKKLVQS